MHITFAEAVADFIAAATWLTEEHKPMVVALEKMAESLDKRLSAAMMAQFGLTYRFLIKQAGGEVETDPLARLLDGEDS